jgi:hypothetical protein
MISQREQITEALYILLEQIKQSNGYNNNVAVIRDRVGWDSTNKDPALFLDEYEPEIIEDIAFELIRGRLSFVVAGKTYGSPQKMNSIVQDIRSILEDEVQNATYQPYLSMQRVLSYNSSSDPSDKLKYLEVYFTVDYFYGPGSS